MQTIKTNILFALSGVIIMTVITVQAQVPGTIYYQGRLTTPAGVPMNNVPNDDETDGRIDLVIRIFSAETGGSEIWSQPFNDLEVNNGLFSVRLDNLDATVVFPATAQVNRWLEVTVTQNGTTSPLAPRERIISVPYAIRAGDADMVDGQHANELGGITSEDDPQVDNDLVNNAVPRWDGTAQPERLVTGSIYNLDNGRVGIGTASPASALHLATGTIRVDGTAPTLYLRGGAVGEKGRIALNHYGHVQFDMVAGDAGDHTFSISPAGSSDAFTITEGKNVGIGTPSPNAGLDISRAGPWGSLAIRNSYSGGITHFDFPDGKNYIRGTTVIADSGGNVGIGTASPGAKLEINRDGGQLKLTGGTYPGGLWTGGGKLYLGNWDTGAGAAVNLANGNVGIGTTTPGSKLTVAGGNIELDSAWNVIKSTGRLHIQSGGTENLFLNPWGNITYVGGGGGGILNVFGSITIGPMTILPPYQLDVKGSAGIRDNVYLGGSVYPYSDDRIKLNEETLEYGLAQVMALDPTRYDSAEWEVDPETKEIVIHPEKISRTNEIGLVAQEVQQVIPEAVHVPEDENRELWGISYDTLVPVLIKAIQEQQEQIESLKQRIETLEQR